MSKKITLITACFLIVFCFSLSVDANENRQERKRLERIEGMVETIEVQARTKGKQGVMDTLAEVRKQIDSLQLRIKERSSEIFEDALLRGNYAHCYFIDEEMSKEEVKAHLGEGKIAVEETIDGEYARLLLLFEEGVSYAWDIDGEDILKSSIQASDAEIEELKEEFFDCSYGGVDKTLFEKPEGAIKWEDYLRSHDGYSDTRIESSIGHLRLLAETNYTFDSGYEEFYEMTKPGHSDYQNYLSIKERVEEYGGELVLKFSKDFGKEDKYRDYCAYSVLNEGDGKEVYCMSSLSGGRRQKSDVKCVTGEAPSCQTE